MKSAFAVIAILVAASSHAQQFTVYATGGKSMTSYHGQADVQSINLEWSARRWKNTDAGFVIGSELLWHPTSWFGGRDHSPYEKVRGLATSLVVRHYLQSHPSWYGEISSGPMWSAREVPAGTSQFNFLSQGGFGAIVGSRWQTPVMIGVRFAHISNAGLARHNPGMNFTAVVMGLRFRP